MGRRKRNRVRWEKGTVLWLVPVRFWEDEYKPERCVVLDDNSKYDYEGEFCTYAFHDEWGHNAYLDPDDLYLTVEECYTEINRRRKVRDQENKKDDDKLMAAIRKALEGTSSMKAVGRALQASWAEGDSRSPGRFKDKTRFAGKRQK